MPNILSVKSQGNFSNVSSCDVGLSAILFTEPNLYLLFLCFGKYLLILNWTVSAARARNCLEDYFQVQLMEWIMFLLFKVMLLIEP